MSDLKYNSYHLKPAILYCAAYPDDLPTAFMSLRDHRQLQLHTTLR
jgi:hypothetical protein